MSLPLPPILQSRFISLFVYAFMLTSLYFSAIEHSIKRWDRPECNYCYLIPIVVFYLIWNKRKELNVLLSTPSWWGLIVVVSGLGLFWLGELGGEFLTLNLSLWTVAVGLFWLHHGWAKVRTAGFALLIALSMFPLPDFLYNKASVKLQLISSKLGVILLQWYGMAAYREGNIIDLGFAQLQVVEACSGLRSLVSLLVLGILLAYFFKASLWKRLLVFISTIPLSVILNSGRIAITGILYESLGAKAAEGFFHGFSGWIIFMCSFCILLLEIWILGRVWGRGKRAESREPQLNVLRIQRGRYGAGGKGQRAKGIEHRGDSIEHAAAGPTGIEKTTTLYGASREERRQRKGWKAWFEPQFIVSFFLLLGTFVVSQVVEFREKIPVKRPLNRLPIEIGKWTGTYEKMEQRLIEKLDLSDYAIINYRDAQNRNVNLYVAYYESQRKGESIHTPATCLPGSGWIFEQAGTTALSVSGYEEGSMKVNRAFMQKNDYKQLSYYWFIQRGRILTNAYQLKIFAFWDALTKQRTDGALVRLITPVYKPEKLEDAEGRLQEFTREIVLVLDEFIPGADLR